jgi:Pyruvate/2-oxoacid:ferredoxin oxidoreductase delta subunit
MNKLLKRNLFTITKQLNKNYMTEKIFIRNTNYPICLNCVHFIPDETNYPYDPLPDDNYGKCKKFGELNLVKGQIDYDMAKACRQNETKCGIKGKEYQGKELKV